MRPIPIALVVVPLFAAAPAMAQTAPAPRSQEARPPDKASPPFSAPAVGDAALGRIAGREDLSIVATATQTAGVTANTVGDNSTTGEVRIADNAFQNLSGLALVNVNTGNNVAINSAMNVSISLGPTP